MDKPLKPTETRPRPGSLSGYREEDGRSERKSQAGEEPMLGSDREFVLGKLHEQTQFIVGKIDALSQRTEAYQQENERRFVALERARVEDQQARLAMQEVTQQVQQLNTNMRQLFEQDRLQNQDIGALSAKVAAANKPLVQAEAASEGMAAGAASGKHAARFWSLLMAVLVTIATSGLQYCQHQIQNGAFEKPAGK